MVGRAVVRRLEREACTVLTVSRQELDLTRQAAVEGWMEVHRPEVVILAAARVGGIWANSAYPAEFMRDNLMMEANVIDASWRLGVRKLLCLGSSCIYPRLAPQPMVEEALLTGPLEPTNEWYALAKIAGIKLCQAYRRQYGCDFISVQPTNLYGPGDHFELETSHVVPALIRKIHEAKRTGLEEVVVWGSGTPLREFLYVEDLADALVFVLGHYAGEMPLNIGSGVETSIAGLAALIAEIVGYRGYFVYDQTKPDGPPRKWVDCGRLTSLGWQARTGLLEGLARTYAWYLENGKSDFDDHRS
jgi:GDP-L-fucose synthase